MDKIEIRFAKPSDANDILKFVNALAVYEKLEHEVVATSDDFIKNLFGPKPFAEVIFLEVNNQKVGFALFFHTFSTFLGKPGIYLEDLFVLPEKRGQSYGKILLSFIAQLALERDCGRLEWSVLDWSVLDWNTPAIDFYKSLGTQSMEGWVGQRLTGNHLLNLAKYNQKKIGGSDETKYS